MHACISNPSGVTARVSIQKPEAKNLESVVVMRKLMKAGRGKGGRQGLLPLRCSNIVKRSSVVPIFPLTFPVLELIRSDALCVQ